MKTFFLFICALAAAVYLYRVGVEEFAAREAREKEAKALIERGVTQFRQRVEGACKATYGAVAEVRQRGGSLVCCRGPLMQTNECEAIK